MFDLSEISFVFHFISFDVLDKVFFLWFKLIPSLLAGCAKPFLVLAALKTFSSV